MLGNMGIKRARFDKIQKPRQCLAGNAFAPVFLAQPVANFTFSQLVKTNNISSDISVKENRLDQYGVIGHDPGPMGHKLALGRAGNAAI